MSWSKESAKVGLSGLTPREAARGALTCPEFQKLPDPLALDPYGWVVKEEDVSTQYCTYLYLCIMSNMSINEYYTV